MISTPDPQPVSAAELAQATAILAKCQPGFLDFDLFIQLARLTAVPVVELVPLRRATAGVEVLLLPRPADDRFWPGVLHVPGTIIRAVDTGNNFADAFERLFKEELQQPVHAAPVFVTSGLNRTKRGTEVIQVFWLDVSGEPTVGQFYPTDQLPSNLMESQRDFIELAVKHYRKTKEN